MKMWIWIIVQLILMAVLNYSFYKDGYMNGVKGAGNAINSAYKFKEVETKPRWTPGIINPQSSGQYLVEYDNGDIDTDYFDVELMEWNSRLYNHNVMDIMAWMELPEPYEKQEKI